MRVQVLVPCIINGTERQSGDVLDLSPELANPLIGSGRGVRAPDEPPPPAEQAETE